ncbi:MAG: hypothetical protein A3F11_06685 [Gammaproteobacteria bacterium RIFCSPHIGHO2_12_FULL_37_14]|nr:MAG: hypothetical protein A3F11_06685 [Gammaproteobacteria bacterium RIFCSPHIGHO2_12_FULL_37_14]
MMNNRKLFEVLDERKDTVNIEEEPSLLDLSPELLLRIGSFLDTQSAGRYDRACKSIHRFFHTDLNILKLLHHAAFGEKKEVEEILKKHPELLYKKDITYDRCGRPIEGTVYRVALGAKDISINQGEEMVEMITRYLMQLPEGEKELARQYAEQFPEAYKAQEEKRRKRDSAALEKVFAAIEKSNTNKDCENAIEEFQCYLKKQTKKVITTGYHFNDQLFNEALRLYGYHYRQFDGCDSRKNHLAAIKVIGGIERYFPACLAQAARGGFGRLSKVNEIRPVFRVLDVADGNTPFYHPELGVSHFIYSGYSESRIYRYALDLTFLEESFLLFYNASQTKLLNLQPIQNPNRPYPDQNEILTEEPKQKKIRLNG